MSHKKKNMKRRTNLNEFYTDMPNEFLDFSPMSTSFSTKSDWIMLFCNDCSGRRWIQRNYSMMECSTGWICLAKKEMRVKENYSTAFKLNLKFIWLARRMNILLDFFYFFFFGLIILGEGLRQRKQTESTVLLHVPERNSNQGHFQGRFRCRFIMMH